MRKFIAIMAAITVLFSTAAFADDLSALTDEELLALHQDVLAEMERRWLPSEPETDSELAEITGRVISFFAAWNKNDTDEMLALCDSGWKATVEDPRTELLRILANRTAMDTEIRAVKEIAGEGPDGLTYYLVTVTAELDRNNGKAPEMYYIQLLVRKEKDGLWYVNPTGLNSNEKTEEEFPEEAEPESEDEAAVTGTLLYYSPEGGEYYHLDQNCKRVNPKYLPLQGSFLYSELNDEPYRELKPCEICGAPARQTDGAVSMSFRDAVDAAGENAAVGFEIDYLAVAAEKDGRYYRTVTILDDRAKELYMAAISTENSGSGFEDFSTYAWTLPVCYTEEITATPKDQAELDAQAGKMIGELVEDGYSFYGSGGGENLPTVVDLSSGLFIYEFEIDVSYEEYLGHEDWDNLKNMKVKSGKLSDSMSIATNLDYLADGTYQPPFVPHITAEELAAADNVAPVEEYSRNAWPLTDESYSELRKNLDDRYGQVYMIEGAVHQVLSESPRRVIIYTGEDGKSQPVVVECPEQRSFNWEAGKTYRIYADVSSALYILPVLTARYTFTGPGDETGR